MTTIKKYLVGGAVRDRLLGVDSSDWDYTVVVDGVDTIDEAWDAMRSHLDDAGYTIFLETKDFLTLRARFPYGDGYPSVTADFVLARKEGPYSDGRRPDWVKPGTLEDDLSRRDFSVNALAEDEDGNIIDLFGGQKDLDDRVLRAVGDPKERLMEDALRVFRALRFAVVKGFNISPELQQAINDIDVILATEKISVERIREELVKMFAADSGAAMYHLYWKHPFLFSVVTEKGLWFKPTLSSK